MSAPTLGGPRPFDASVPPYERSAAGKSGGALNLLAFAGLVFLIYQSWTWISWLSDGPRQITEFRNTEDFSWYLAIGYQVTACTAVAIILIYVVRGCVRARTLTLDAMICVAGICSFWLDATANVFQPVFLYSSQWINLNDWTGHMPGIVNPDAGRLPESFLFTLPLYLGGILIFLKIICWAMERCQRRWPGLKTWQLVTIAMIGGLLVEVAIEYPMYAFDLWAYPGHPNMPSAPFLSEARRYPVAEMIFGMLMFGPWALMYYFRNDRGQTIVERGLSHQGTGRRLALTQLRLIGVFNGVMVFVASLYWLLGLHSQPYPEDMKPYIVNNACDAPGYSGTRYGPCPGSPDYRMPLRDSLPPPAPGDWVKAP